MQALLEWVLKKQRFNTSSKIVFKYLLSQYISRSILKVDAPAKFILSIGIHLKRRFLLMFQFAYFLCRPIPMAAGLRCYQGEEQGQGLRPQEVCLGPQQGEVYKNLITF